MSSSWQKQRRHIGHCAGHATAHHPSCWRPDHTHRYTCHNYAMHDIVCTTHEVPTNKQLLSLCARVCAILYALSQSLHSDQPLARMVHINSNSFKQEQQQRYALHCSALHKPSCRSKSVMSSGNMLTPFVTNIASRALAMLNKHHSHTSHRPEWPQSCRVSQIGVPGAVCAFASCGGLLGVCWLFLPGFRGVPSIRYGRPMCMLPADMPMYAQILPQVILTQQHEV